MLKDMFFVLFFLQCDLTSDQFSDDELEAFCKERFFFDWFKTSAKENIGLDDAIKCLLTRVCSVLYTYTHAFVTTPFSQGEELFVCMR